jgi:microcystin-dependent protein
MTDRVQTTRFAATGDRPTTGKAGELYVNFADNQVGMVGPGGGNQDLVAIRFFSTTANYNIGDYVVQGGLLYRATAAGSGPWVAANWSPVEDGTPLPPPVPAGLVPIGGIIIWTTPTIPAGFLACDGAVYNIVDVPDYWAAVGNVFPGGNGTTTVAVPQLRDRSVIGSGATYSMLSTGGEINHTLVIGEITPHGHVLNDPTHGHGLTEPGHNHSVNDPGHNHGQSAHTHGIGDPGHAHGTSLMKFIGSGGPYGIAGGGNSNVTTTNTDGAGTGIYTGGANAGIAAAGVGVYNSAAVTGRVLQANGTGQTVAASGGGAAHNNMPPFMALPYCIRFK